METGYIVYMAAWGSLCLGALWLSLRLCVSAPRPSLFERRYYQFLLVRWKWLTFVGAATAITLIAPYTGDPTWDYADALIMSGLTYLSAPWVLGTLYQALRGEMAIGTRLAHGYIAVCLWMFSASWCYDLYLVWRDGYYPATWLANIFASSVLYVAAGLFWNLEWKARRGVIFSFMEPGWPAAPATPGFARVFWYALPFMLIVVCAMAYFLLT